MTKITLKEIAAHFNVSISTVSKAIRDSHEISEKLRKKIQVFARAHNYKPNTVALSLLNRSTKTIGVVVPNILNYFFTQVFYGIEKVANSHGYNIISCISNESFEKEAATLEFLSSGTVDGLIISMAEETQFKNNRTHLQQMIDNQTPMVMFDRVMDGIACDKVIVDDFEAGYKTTNFFFNTGCQTIAIVTTIDHSSVGQLRVEGYKKALAERNLNYDDKLVLRVGKKDDLDLLMSFLLNYKTIDGIMALDEITAVEVMRIVQSRGYHVPRDISIIGFTNGKISQYITPALTTVSQHGTYIGETAAGMLIKRLENKTLKQEYTTKLIKTSLIVRESTRKL